MANVPDQMLGPLTGRISSCATTRLKFLKFIMAGSTVVTGKWVFLLSTETNFDRLNGPGSDLTLVAMLGVP